MSHIKHPSIILNTNCVCASVSGWTGQQQNLCLFRKGDRILAINDLHTSSVEEFNMYVSRLLRDEVRSWGTNRTRKCSQWPWLLHVHTFVKLNLSQKGNYVSLQLKVTILRQPGSLPPPPPLPDRHHDDQPLPDHQGWERYLAVCLAGLMTQRHWVCNTDPYVKQLILRPWPLHIDLSFYCFTPLKYLEELKYRILKDFFFTITLLISYTKSKLWLAFSVLIYNELH